MSSLSIIASPLQLINAIEAINDFNLNTNDLLIIKTTNNINDEQIDRILNNQQDIKWRNLIIINFTDKVYEKVFFAIKIAYTLKKIRATKYDFIFLGNYRSTQMRHLANIVFTKNLYLIDDGSATIGLDKYEVKKDFKYYIYNFFGYKQALENYSLFTMYKKELFVDSIYNTYRLNSFNIIKKSLTSKPKIKQVYFIGQHLIELGVIDYNYYYQYLSSIIDFYKKQDLVFVYILHRSNNYALFKQLSSDLNFTIIKFDYPIEIQLLYMKKLPEQFATFYSTGAMTIKKLLPNSNITAFYIDNSKLGTKFKKNLNLDKYYQNMHNENIFIQNLSSTNNIEIKYYEFN